MTIHRTCVAALCAAWIAVAAPSQESPAAEKPARVELSEGAKSALGELQRLDRQLKGVRGPERTAALQQLAERCAAVATEFAAERTVAARAWFESGEAWRRHGSPDQAEAAYQKALDNDDGRYRARASFEVAQMQRRQKQLEKAVESYRRAAEVEPESNRGHDARVWIARCLDELERPDEALAAYRAAVDAAGRARQCIDAGNWLAKALVARGDLDGAAAAIGAAEAAARADADEDDAAAIEKTLEKMSARRALQRARDKAQGAARDAVQLEADRGQSLASQRTPMP